VLGRHRIPQARQHVRNRICHLFVPYLASGRQ
jgi:hypothetical protein